MLFQWNQTNKPGQMKIVYLLQIEETGPETFVLILEQ